MRFRSSTLQPPSLPFSALRLEPEHRDLEDHPVTAGCIGDRILLLHESERVMKTACRLRLPTSQPTAAEPPDRQRVVKGTGVYVGCDLGVSRIITIKLNTQKNKST